MEKTTRNSVTAVIPARMGSKSIPAKNIKDFAGKPLIYWAAKAANDSSVVKEVLISTDSARIRDTAEGFGLKKLRVVARSRRSSLDNAPSEVALLEAAERYNFNDLLFLQGTNPFVTSKDIEKAYRLYKNKNFDSLLSAVFQKKFLWSRKRGAAIPLNYDYNNRPRRQDFKGFFVENGAFYITSRKRLKEYKNRLSGKIGIYPMPQYSYFELDEPADWDLAEAVFLKKELYLRRGVDLKKIRLLALDVDGVFTDGSVYCAGSGERMVKFSRVDGKGIVEFLKKKRVLVISAEESGIARSRLEKLKIKENLFGVRDKWGTLKRYLDRENINLSETAFMGDDIQDLEVIEKVGFSACPANAVQEVKKKADYVCKRRGGSGAIREVIDLIL
ncbi:MAG: acylneuraminate cytidylyltransferase [Candidatus Omnitrophica bacterium]|nr:acylneuraminate cytidylyltransferase [Candidatus Omnitrophota bacterium]